MSSPLRGIGAEQPLVGSAVRLRNEAARWMARAGSVAHTTTRNLRDRGFGLSAVLMVSGCAYLLAIFGFFAILLPLAAPRAREAI